MLLVDFVELEQDIKRNKIHNCYVFCGVDEVLIKESIELISKKVLEGPLKDLNYVEFDGTTVDMEQVVNTANTVPFMSEKKLIVIYRSNFLGETEDRESTKRFEAIMEYIKNSANHCVLIMYYIFGDSREKPSKRIKKLEKDAYVVKFDKLKGAALEKKVKSLFDAENKEIGKLELKLFCDYVENNMYIIQNEVQKLCSYAYDKEIQKEDILKLLPAKSDNDIFNLVDNISQKKVEKALDILNELLFKGEKVPYILFMVERQVNILLQLKIGLEEGKNKDTLARELSLNPYICEKMIIQSRKFTVNSIRKALEACLNTEEVLKSASVDSKTEMELLIINAITA